MHGATNGQNQTITKIYVDSKSKTKSNNSTFPNDSFQYTIPGCPAVTCGDPRVVAVSDFTCNHTWPNIQSENNPNIHIREKTPQTFPPTYQDTTISLPTGTYDITSPAQTLQTLINQHCPGTYSVTETSPGGKISIAKTAGNAGGTGFQVFNHFIRAGTPFDGQTTNTNPKSLQSVLNTPGPWDPSIPFDSIGYTLSWTSGPVVLIHSPSIHLRCNELAGSVIDQIGDTSCIKGIPVVTQSGDQLFDTSSQSERDYLDVSSRVLKH